MVIDTGATSNTVGGTAAAARNVISGNSASGVFVTDSGATDNLVAGQLHRHRRRRHRRPGQRISRRASSTPRNNTVGGTASGAGNVICGNVGSGVWLYATATGNLIAGNFIGTDATGTAAVGNQATASNVTADGVTIGGTTATARNVISGNTATGVSLFNTGTTGDLVEGNYIGTDATGTAALANSYGLYRQRGEQHHRRYHRRRRGNVICGNPHRRRLHGSGASGNLVAGNYVGTDATGTAIIAGSNYGVEVASAASGNTIGGTTAAARNVISGNADDGVWLRERARPAISSRATTSAPTPPAPPRWPTASAC